MIKTSVTQDHDLDNMS